MRYLFIVISGILFASPFIFPELYILSFIAGAPFFVLLFESLINQNTKRFKLIKYTFVFGLGFYLPVYIWFLWMYPMEQTGVTPLQSAFIVMSAWLGFSLVQITALLILPVGLIILGHKYKCRSFFLPVITACLYITAEWVQSWFLSGLTWAKLPVSQYKNLFFIQSSSLLGTYFISFVIIFINSCAALYILNRKNNINNKNNNILILAVVLLYFSNSYFGLLRIYFLDNFDNSEGEITAYIIQGNISSYDKWADSEGRNSLEIYESLIKYIKNEEETPVICVMPETAVPSGVSYNGTVYNRLKSSAAENNITLFTGAIYYNRENDERYNAIMAFDKNYDFIEPYAKRHLVPFGEYLPFENILTEFFPFAANISIFDGALTAGKNSNIMTVNGINYGGLVCFDSIFPELARKSVRDGADILIIATNDSWFRNSTAKPQHNAHAVLRAVENNRYVIRSANTGISSFISPSGKIISRSNILEREILREEIKIIKSTTLYTVCGDIILYFAWGYICFCLLEYKIIKYINIKKLSKREKNHDL
ncbi:MAG: apolipoprotein N-acyltransferase [Oscillospiraceae bacterium]|nr:apolipoprotein N-acyltransferase [Oscillospiraceae bacterium]